MTANAFQIYPPQDFEPISVILNNIYDYEYSLDEPDFYNFPDGKYPFSKYEEIKAYSKAHADLRISIVDVQTLKNIFDKIVMFLWEEKLLTFKNPLQSHLLKVSSCINKLNVPKGRAGIDNPHRPLKIRLDTKLQQLISKQNFLTIKYQRFLEAKSISSKKHSIYIVKSKDEANLNNFDLHSILFKHDNELDFSEILQLIKETEINDEKLIDFEELLESISFKIIRIRENWINQILKLFKSGEYHCWAMSSTFDSSVLIPPEQWGSNYTIDIKGNIKKVVGSYAENYIELHVYKGVLPFVEINAVRYKNDAVLNEKIAAIENITQHISQTLESFKNEQQKAPRKINKGEQLKEALSKNINKAKAYIIEEYNNNPNQIPQGSKAKFIPFLMEEFGFGRDAAYKAYTQATIEVHSVTKEETKTTKLWQVKRGRPKSQ